MTDDAKNPESLPQVTGVHLIGTPTKTAFVIGYNKSKGAQHYNTRVIVPSGVMTVGPNCTGLTCTVSDLVASTTFLVTVVAHASNPVRYSPPSATLTVKTAA